MLPDGAFRHFDLAARSQSLVHLPVSILVLLLEGERAYMLSALMLHELEKVKKPFFTTVFVALLRLVAAFELLRSLHDLGWRQKSKWHKLFFID